MIPFVQFVIDVVNFYKNPPKEPKMSVEIDYSTAPNRNNTMKITFAHKGTFWFSCKPETDVFHLEFQDIAGGDMWFHSGTLSEMHYGVDWGLILLMKYTKFKPSVKIVPRPLNY